MKRSASSRQWLKRHVNDEFVQRARRDGYRSRAAYKLLEICERDRLLKPGQVVVDLGAAPGSWAQVALARVGSRGHVVALDLLPIAPLPGLVILQGDFLDGAVADAVTSALAGRRVDLVLSDMSPNISGIAVSDQARAMYLAEVALDFARNHLNHGGAFLVKVFQGSGFEEFLRDLRSAFEKVVSRKPRASRSESSEQYLLATGFSPGSR
jgi:23S rRNA (uridine2552-2'-O)-methyltransferase